MFTNDKILAAARFILRDEIQSLRNEAYVIWEMIYIKGIVTEHSKKKLRFSNKLEGQADVIEKVVKGDVSIFGKIKDHDNKHNFVTRIILKGVTNYFNIVKQYDLLSKYGDDPNDKFWEMKKDLIAEDFGLENWEQFIELLKEITNFRFYTKKFIKE